MASPPKIPRFPRRLLAKIREPGYTRTGQQDTDAILQDEVTRTLLSAAVEDVHLRRGDVYIRLADRPLGRSRDC
jgi:hypothetical protein